MRMLLDVVRPPTDFELTIFVYPRNILKYADDQGESTHQKGPPLLFTQPENSIHLCRGSTASPFVQRRGDVG